MRDSVTPSGFGRFYLFAYYNNSIPSGLVYYACVCLTVYVCGYQYTPLFKSTIIYLFGSLMNDQPAG
jgi:hypothetical protein